MGGDLIHHPGCSSFGGDACDCSGRVVPTPARVAPERRESCQWKYDGSECRYQTECGEAFCFIDGSASDNGVFYCHHCGGLVRVVRLCSECDVAIPEASESDLCDKCLTAEDDDE